MAAAMTCADSEELLALAALGVLSRKEAEPLDAHLRVCAACHETAAGCVRSVTAMAVGLPDPAPPASLRQVLLRTAYRDARTPSKPAPHRLRQGRPAARGLGLRTLLTRRRLLALAAPGLAVAAVLVAVLVLVRPGGEHGAVPARTYTVVGSTTDPGVHGTLTEYSGAQQSVISVSGLRQPGASVDGTPGVYELWVVRADGAALGVAFLAQSPVDGTWSSVIDADLAHAVVVAATAEPAGGSHKPTGAEVFSVQLTR